MENKFQLLLYIVFGVIYVISRIIKNRNKSVEQQEQAPVDEYKQPAPAPMSFEDLLKEFTGEQTTKRPVQEVEKQSYEFEKELPTDGEIDKVYQESIAQAQYQEEELDSKKLRHDVEFKRFEEFDKKEENTFLTNLMKDMQEEEGLKKAIIYKEILDRKY